MVTSSGRGQRTDQAGGLSPGLGMEVSLASNRNTGSLPGMVPAVNPTGRL